LGRGAARTDLERAQFARASKGTTLLATSHMDADLSALVDLQRLDTLIDTARRILADLPLRQAAIDGRLTEATARLDTAKQQAADNQAARRAVEKDLAVVQGRLEKFKDQTMAVKTNKEFHALQHEIAVAQEEIRGFEDQVLECMMRGDELAATVKAAEAGLADARRAGEEERAQLAAEHTRVETELAARLGERQTAAARVSKHALALFESIRRSRGIAVTEMRDGRCSICQVRLRPQVAQIVRRNDSVNQCDSCGRILYYVPPAAAPPAGTVPDTAAGAGQ
jgi:predicted  nucleic acid-binding Zn-ribbon protein